MADYELIKRFCDLTCSKEDIERKKDTIEYDTEFPFKKYYKLDTIIGAINKYISHEWDENMLAYWASRYDNIICGGFDDNLKEDLNSLENFIKEDISWGLDSLSFFSEEWMVNGITDLYDWLEGTKVMDHVWQTRENLRAVYAMVGDCAEFNDDQYVVLINDLAKEFIILHSDFLKNGFEDEHFKYVSEDEFKELIEQLQEKPYKMLSGSEKWYYLAIGIDIDDDDYDDYDDYDDEDEE